MWIPTYQIDNVLKHFTEQLTGGCGRRDGGGRVQAEPSGESGAFSLLNRRQIIEAITKKIKNAVGGIDSAGRWGHQINIPLSAAGSEKTAGDGGAPSSFVYNMIDRDHRKIQRMISVTKFYEP